ncbi:MAG TPA: hypothetical protein VLV16_11135 [Gemmatimonadales bacterium]|nr:hypothetical protein [Gemmatimonadales bacterium]
MALRPTPGLVLPLLGLLLAARPPLAAQQPDSAHHPAVQAPAPQPAAAPTAPVPQAIAQEPDSEPGDSVAPADPGWPRAYDLAHGGTAVIYQPQIASWEEQRYVVAWSAVAYQAKGAQEPALGTIRIEASTDVSVPDRLVHFSDFKITNINFKKLTKDQLQQLLMDLMDVLPDSERIMSLDRALAGVDKSQIVIKNAEGLKADPPPIFYSSKPAILVNLDGEPIWSPVTGVDLSYAVNTNWDLFKQASGDTLYLRYLEVWMTAPTLKGPWVPVKKLPETFKNFPADSNWAEVRKNVPGKRASDDLVVFVSLKPAELIAFDGDPKFEPIKNTRLLWVSNTESDLFELGEKEKGPYYICVAGRWFWAPDMDGPWTFASLKLPADFKKIPVDHPRSRVLASIPGTPQAVEAVLLAQIPTTAQVSIKDTKPPAVVYNGDPKFEKISGTQVSRAVNTDKDILKVGDTYYMCFQGVWFVSKQPTGEWQVATSVPKEIYDIPPSSPAYNVTYVTVQQTNPSDPYVTCAYAAGYTGIMIAWGVAVYGSGWYYPPYAYGHAYYGYPMTYGFGAWYNPYTGAYGRGTRVYGPYGGAGYGASYNPTTGTYKRGAAAYGPYGSRATAQAYNPRTGTAASTRQGSNVYGNWGSSTVKRGDSWVQTAHKTDYRSGTTTSGARTSNGGAAVRRTGPEGSGGVVRTGSGDVYAGRDGNVYKKGSDGSWNQVGGGGNTAGQLPSQGGAAGQRPAQGAGGGAAAKPGTQPSTRPPSATTNDLNRDAAARQSGNARAQGQGQYRGSSSSTRGSMSGSYGGMRGGGGRGGGGRRR